MKLGLGSERETGGVEEGSRGFRGRGRRSTVSARESVFNCHEAEKLRADGKGEGHLIQSAEDICSSAARLRPPPLKNPSRLYRKQEAAN